MDNKKAKKEQTKTISAADDITTSIIKQLKNGSLSENDVDTNVIASLNLKNNHHTDFLEAYTECIINQSGDLSSQEIADFFAAAPFDHYKLIVDFTRGQVDEYSRIFNWIPANVFWHLYNTNDDKRAIDKLLYFLEQERGNNQEKIDCNSYLMRVSSLIDVAPKSFVHFAGAISQHSNSARVRGSTFHEALVQLIDEWTPSDLCTWSEISSHYDHLTLSPFKISINLAANNWESAKNKFNTELCEIVKKDLEQNAVRVQDNKLEWDVLKRVVEKVGINNVEFAPNFGRSFDKEVFAYIGSNSQFDAVADALRAIDLAQPTKIVTRYQIRRGKTGPALQKLNHNQTDTLWAGRMSQYLQDAHSFKQNKAYKQFVNEIKLDKFDLVVKQVDLTTLSKTIEKLNVPNSKLYPKIIKGALKRPDGASILNWFIEQKGLDINNWTQVLLDTNDIEKPVENWLSNHLTESSRTLLNL